VVLHKELTQRAGMGMLRILEGRPTLEESAADGGINVVEPEQGLRIVNLEIGGEAVTVARSFIDEFAAMLHQPLQQTGLRGLRIDAAQPVAVPEHEFQQEVGVYGIVFASGGEEGLPVLAGSGGMDRVEDQ